MGKAARKASRAKRKELESRVRIVVGAAPSGVSLGREIELIKPALIYGDVVVLCSPTATLLEQLAAFTKLSSREQVAAIGQIAFTAGLVGPDFQQGLALVGALPKIKRSGLLPESELDELEGLVEGLDEKRRELTDVICAQFAAARGEELVPALDCGALQIEQLGTPDGEIDGIIEALLNRLLAALTDRRSYVICDEIVGDLVTAGSQVLARSGGATHRARTAGAGTGLS